MVRIHRTGATPSDLVLTDDILSRKGSGQHRELEAALVRFVAPVLQEPDIQKLVRTWHELDARTTGTITENINVDSCQRKNPDGENGTGQGKSC
jgi:hypothetical protein